MAGLSQNTLFRKIFIMIWKNCILRKRHYIQTALEIILPTLLFVILVAIHSTGDSTNSSGESTNVIEADIPKVKWYPMEYCSSLLNMLEKEGKGGDDDSQELTVLAREIFFTNVPGNEDVNQVDASRLVFDIMKSVQNTVNYFLVPCCTLNTNLTLTDTGILSK